MGAPLRIDALQHQGRRHLQGLCLAPGSTEPVRLPKRPPQEELHLSVDASQVVRGPPSQCVEDLGVQAQVKCFAFAHVSSVSTKRVYDGSLRMWDIYGGSADDSWMNGSDQRFCIAADRVSSFDGTTVDEGIEFAFDTLDAIAWQHFSEHASHWSMVFMTGAGRVELKTFANPDLRYVDLKDFSVWCEQPVQMLEIHEPLIGDVGPWFRDYSHSEALDHFVWFVNFYETTVTPAWAGQVLRHFESFICEPRLRIRRATRRYPPGAAPPR